MVTTDHNYFIVNNIGIWSLVFPTVENVHPAGRI